MDLAANLYLTPKGVEEVKTRVHKLNIKKRSVLLLLEKLQTIEYVLSKAVFRREEVIEEIRDLAQEGFLVIGGEALPVASADKAAAAAPISPSSARYQLNPEIILSEAKYLLIDFCFDNFGTRSEAFSDEIRACKSVAALGFFLETMVAEVGRQCPDRLPVLDLLVSGINETA